MFIGHFAVGFAAKRWAPRTSLGVLLAAPLLADMLFPVLVLAGVERAHIVEGETPFLHLSLDSYPWSHSLLMDLVWAALFAGIVWWRAKDRTGRLALAALAALLALAYVGNVMSPPPPGIGAVAVTGVVAAVLMPLWAWWIDRHREPVGR